MQFFKTQFTLLTVLCGHIAFSTAASTTPPPWSPQCLDEKLSMTLADHFGHLISNWTSNSTASEITANQIIAPSFQDLSESVMMLVSRGCTTGPQPIYADRDAWKKGQLTVPPLPYERLQIWQTCEDIIVRWRTPQAVYNVTGLYVLHTIVPPRSMDTPYRRVIDQTWSEFNSAAWLISTGWKGGNCTE